MIKRKDECAIQENDIEQHKARAPVRISEPDDNVNYPAHYTYGTIEVIDVIEGLRLPYHLGNAVKYIARAGKKDPAKTEEDLQKAIWYINRYIAFLGKQKEAE